MKVYFKCDLCGADIDTIEVSHLDEKKLGIDILTEEERRQLVYYDVENDTLHVQSLCDNCIAGINLDGETNI